MAHFSEKDLKATILIISLSLSIFQKSLQKACLIVEFRLGNNLRFSI
jgi:hypothetical protein